MLARVPALLSRGLLPPALLAGVSPLARHPSQGGWQRRRDTAALPLGLARRCYLYYCCWYYYICFCICI